MKKILPLAVAPIEAYQGTSFILSVILSYENTADAYFNNYINVWCDNIHHSHKINLNFASVTWEDYRVKGVAEMNLYHLKNIHRDTFIDFIKERIDQENYLLFYNVDEYYLSYTGHFQNKHNIHDTYVYGYNDDFWNVLAYKGGKLTRFEVPMLELLRALYYREESIENVSFCTFRPNHSIKEVINLSKIKQSLWDYSNSEHLGNKSSASVVYGINTYDILIQCLKNALYEFNTDIFRVDLRPFRLFWEHKKVLKDHVLKLSEMVLIDNVVNETINEIESQSSIIFKLMIKYKINNDAHILEKVVAYLSQLKKKEEKLINLLSIALEQ